MFGLAYILFFAVYLAVSILVIRWAVRHARKHEKNVWLWGGVSAFIMYNLVFWDWFPTVVAHKYYCSSEAGFWVYKTVEQWKAENPGVAQTLVPRKPGDNSRDIQYPDGDRMMMNQRIAWDSHRHRILPLLPVFRTDYFFIDTKTNEVLAKRSEVGTVVSPYVNGVTGYKFWLNQPSCSPDKQKNSKFMSDIHNMGVM